MIRLMKFATVFKRSTEISMKLRESTALFYPLQSQTTVSLLWRLAVMSRSLNDGNIDVNDKCVLYMFCLHICCLCKVKVVIISCNLLHVWFIARLVYPKRYWDNDPLAHSRCTMRLLPLVYVSFGTGKLAKMSHHHSFSYLRMAIKPWYTSLTYDLSN